MSLTSILKNGFSKVILENIPIPRDKFQGSKECVVKPRTKNYSLVGTAFDYLLRSYLKFLHPDAEELSIIGLTSLNIIEKVIERVGEVKLENRTLGKRS